MADKLQFPALAATLALLFTTIGCLLIAPVAFLPINPSVTWTNIATCLCSLGQTIIQVSTFKELLMTSNYVGFKDCAQTSMRIAGEAVKITDIQDSSFEELLLAGLWKFFQHFGGGGGPILLGLIVDKYGFRIASTVMFGINSAMLLITCTDICLNLCKAREEMHSAEIRPLLKPNFETDNK